MRQTFLRRNRFHEHFPVSRIILHSLGDLGVAVARVPVELHAEDRAHALHVHVVFSNRRRHTRSIGDWSSDVCSSDLRIGAPFPAILTVNTRGARAATLMPTQSLAPAAVFTRICTPFPVASYGSCA